MTEETALRIAESLENIAKNVDSIETGLHFILGCLCVIASIALFNFFKEQTK